MIEVFKTNVQERHQAKALINLLLTYLPDSKINFDLNDCDKILRIEGKNFEVEKVVTLISEKGYTCTILE